MDYVVGGAQGLSTLYNTGKNLYDTYQINNPVASGTAGTVSGGI
jgi:hypothetical protein